jgi:hypothetical protein
MHSRIRQLWGLESRTLDRVMGFVVDPPKPTIPVMVVDAVSIRTIGGESRRSESRGGGVEPRSSRENSRLRCLRVLHVVGEEGVELRYLQLDIGEGGLHLRLPNGERRRRFL